MSDIGRAASFGAAVVVGDATRAMGLVTPAELAGSADRAARRPGAARARRVACRMLGEFDGCRKYGRLLRPGHGVRGEAPSGRAASRGRRDALLGLAMFEEVAARLKCGWLLRRGQRPGDAVFVEKRRAGGPRAEGYVMLCWAWLDLAMFEEVAASLHRASTSRGGGWGYEQQ